MKLSPLVILLIYFCYWEQLSMHAHHNTQEKKKNHPILFIPVIDFVMTSLQVHTLQ